MLMFSMLLLRRFFHAFSCFLRFSSFRYYYFACHYYFAAAMLRFSLPLSLFAAADIIADALLPRCCLRAMLRRIIF